MGKNVINSRKKISKTKKASIKRTIRLIKTNKFKFILGLIFLFIGVFVMLSIISFFSIGYIDQSNIDNKQVSNLLNDNVTKNWFGVIGAYTSQRIVNGGFGIFSIFIPIFIIYVGLKMMNIIRTSVFKLSIILFIILFSGSIFASFIFGKLLPDSHIKWGGAHGVNIERLLESAIGTPGMLLLIFLFFTILIFILTESPINYIQNKFSKKESNLTTAKKNNWFKSIFFIFKRNKDKKDLDANFNEMSDKIEDIQFNSSNNVLDDKFQIIDASKEEVEAIESNSDNIDDFKIIVPQSESDNDEPIEAISNVKLTTELSHENDTEEDYDPKKDLSSFQFPTSQLLKVYNLGNSHVNIQEQNENKDKIINTLSNYGIEITSIKATVGPTITLYEIVPKAGIRISKIKNLEDDIALSLSALGIRIIAPMPGKGTIGIEVPNKDPQIVSMQSVISSKKFKDCTFDLPIALGKTITNDVFIFDLAKMPHLLVAGATGQGKSVGLNAIITSLLYKKHPAEMKMVLIDPKMVEFNIYSTIEKHYLAKLPDEEKAIITDVSKVTQTLNSITKEMDDRYELLMRASVRTIKEYNAKFIKRRLNPKNGNRYMPYIVVVIDEFGDLIMTAGKEIEMPIARIAQKARAVGIHMVIATQRPTTNIITGTIKANFPARMAFRVTSQIDSRTILDMTGANQLIGRGDMLFSQGSDLIRIQCAFVDTPEVEDIAKYIGTQMGYEGAFTLPEVLSNEENKTVLGDTFDRDPLFEDAARLIVTHQQGSTSLIQRKFSIGYNRAGRLMDQMQAAGIVGAIQGSKPREVYIQDEYSLEKHLDSLR